MFNNIATKRVTKFAAETYTTELKENRLSYRLLSLPLFLYSDHSTFPKIKPDFIFLMVSHHLQKPVKVPNKGDKIFHSLFFVFLSSCLSHYVLDFVLQQYPFFISLTAMEMYHWIHGNGYHQLYEYFILVLEIRSQYNAK